MQKVTFLDDAVYSAEEVAKILNRDVRTIRKLCRKKLIACRASGGGYLIGGWAVKDYVSGRLVIES